MKIRRKKGTTTITIAQDKKKCQLDVVMGNLKFLLGLRLTKFRTIP